ncbi:MAG: hypothetical protein ACRD9R_13705, partial [Pyrinomonadaceae bacterium]
LVQRWVDLPGFSKATASFGERLMYEFGLAGRELVANPDITSKENLLRWAARIQMIILCAIVLALTGYAWRKFRRSERGGEHTA